MKIYNFGLGINPGKYKYNTLEFEALVTKFAPQKISPYTVEFLDADVDKADAVVFSQDKKLDFVLSDLERVERRLIRTEDPKERILLEQCQKILEKETLLCDNVFPAAEGALLRVLQLVTFKPCVGVLSAENINDVIGQVLDKAGVILFYTAAKKEVHAWSIQKGETILEAAGKIHSDLKRGFIKAEIINCKEFENFFNFAEAKARGQVKIVDRDYIVCAHDIVEIKFNV